MITHRPDLIDFMIVASNPIPPAWVVWVGEHDHSGEPDLIACYDGDGAEAAAMALVEMITRAGCYRRVRAEAVPRWPLVT